MTEYHITLRSLYYSLVSMSMSIVQARSEPPPVSWNQEMLYKNNEKCDRNIQFKVKMHKNVFAPGS